MSKDTTVVLGAHGVVDNASGRSGGPISNGAEWSFELLAKYDRAIAEIAVGEYGLDCYPNQIEVISSEQMLDAYARTAHERFDSWGFEAPGETKCAA